MAAAAVGQRREPRAATAGEAGSEQVRVGADELAIAPRRPDHPAAADSWALTDRRPSAAIAWLLNCLQAAAATP